DGAQHRLERVGQQRAKAPTAALGDALAQEEVVAQAELLGQGGERVRVDHGGAELRHLAFLGPRPDLEQVLGRDELQDGVAQVLQPLVVARRHVRTLVGERAVGQGLPQQRGVTEGDADLLLELLEAAGRDLGVRDETASASAGASLGYEAAFSWMYSQA